MAGWARLLGGIERGTTDMGLARTTLLAAASIGLSCGLAAAEPALVTRNINLRAGPGTSFPIVASIPGGSTVDAADCKGEWCSVHWGKHAGHAIRAALDFGDGSEPPPGAPVGGAPPAVVYGPPVVVGPPVVYGPGLYWGRGWYGRGRWWR
jgi:uncharacterized protein YraI